MADFSIRDATRNDWEGIWRVVGAVVEEGDAFALEGERAQELALGLWFGQEARAYVAVETGSERIIGTYVIKPNQPGRGSHVCNGSYAVAPHARGRGVARAMGAHSLAQAKRLGYRAMQFNLVVSSNEPAVRLWRGLGFEVVGRLPGAFRSRGRDGKAGGWVDALVMWRDL